MTASEGQQQIEALDSVVDNPTGVREEVAAVEPQLAEIQAALATLRSDIEARLLTPGDSPTFGPTPATR